MHILVHIGISYCSA